MHKKIMVMAGVFIICFPVLSFSQEISLNEKLCFYGEDYVDEPVRFVYYNKEKQEYTFIFMEEDNKTRKMFTSTEPSYKDEGILYTKGALKIDKEISQYYNICIKKVN